MSPEALNEKPAETALADGTIPFRKAGKEKTDSIISNITTGTARLIRFARTLPCNLLLKTYGIHSSEDIIFILGIPLSPSSQLNMQKPPVMTYLGTVSASSKVSSNSIFAKRNHLHRQEKTFLEL